MQNASLHPVPPALQSALARPRSAGASDRHVVDTSSFRGECLVAASAVKVASPRSLVDRWLG
jgi:hypothetical protein